MCQLWSFPSPFPRRSLLFAPPPSLLLRCTRFRSRCRVQKPRRKSPPSDAAAWRVPSNTSQSSEKFCISSLSHSHVECAQVRSVQHSVGGVHLPDVDSEP
uniref:Uncharacterized protein n=1 Tax=Physcomitrium patens TaxID=3218 RepID=A0A2K1K6T7_PHYPA|nr:hypothetical protein PHYPA_011387 [Physcomitrium patens]